jgi:hypothetical protein
MMGAALAWSEAVLEGAARYRQALERETEAEAIEWLDEADLERVRILDAARAEAERVAAAGEAARRALIEQGRAEAERRVDAGDLLAEEFLAEADAERDAIIARALDEAARIRTEAEAVLERSLADADHERMRLIAAARDEIVALRADADQAMQAEAALVLERARLEADTVRAEADRHALIVRAEATAAFVRHIEQAAGGEPHGVHAPVVEGFIGSGPRRALNVGADDTPSEPPEPKPRRRLARLLLRSRT